MDYDTVNAAFNKVYFDGRHAFSPVYLDPDDQNLGEIGRELGVPPRQVAESTGKVVSGTLKWGSRNPYSSHLNTLSAWERSKSAKQPPFTALLGCFAIAAERMRGDEHYSANNFYQRLADVFGVPEGRTQELRSAGNHTSAFWEALNKWLVTNDYAFGQPTAHSLYERKPYVGYAISQSLVRDVDRRRFATLFDSLHLSKDDNVTIGEMTLFVEQWISGPHGPTETLRKLAKYQGVKERIAEAALQELAAYDPTQSATGNEISTATRLFWAIVERTFPRRQVVPYMATSREGVADRPLTGIGPYTIGSDLRLLPLGATGISCLSSRAAINYSILLLAPIELRDGIGRCFSHAARSVVPLQKREGETFLREVQRVSPLVPHYILCHESIEPTVRQYLSAYAAGGFESERGSVGTFPPDGWFLIRNVRIIRAPSPSALESLKGLEDLTIFTRGDDMSLEGGIQLARNIWHASEPPDVFVATDDPGAKIRLIDGEEELAVLDVQSYNVGFMREVSTQLVGRNLLLELVGQNGRKIASDRVSLRSADHPRLLHETYELFYDLGDPSAVGFGLSAIELATTRWIRGFLTEGVDEVSVPRSGDTLDEDFIDIPTETSDDLLEETPILTSYGEGGIVESCVLRGHHLWLADFDNVSRTCRACGAFVLMRDLRPQRMRRGRRRRVELHSDSRGSAATPATAAPIFAGAVKQYSKSISLNTTFDAVCYSRSGDWAQLQRLVSGACADHLEVFKFCRALADLGHIDVMLDNELVRPKGWSVAPASLVVTRSGSAFLSGFRSGKLIDQLCAALERRGAQTIWVPQACGPDCLRFDIGGATARDFQESLAGLHDAFGRTIHVAESVGLRLACALPNSGQLEANLKRVHVDAGTSLQNFDFATGRWTDSRLMKPGAYRDRSRGSTYLLFNGEHVASGPFELVKLLSAKLAGRRLHSYDASSRNFTCVLGCEPPGLFRRALISCTGLLPRVANGLLTYDGVTEDLGYTVLEKLYT